MVIFGSDPNRMMESERNCRRACGARSADITQNFIHDHCYSDHCFFFSSSTFSSSILFFVCSNTAKEVQLVDVHSAHCVLVADRSRSVSKIVQILCMQSKFVCLSLCIHIRDGRRCVPVRLRHVRMVIIMDVSEAMRTLLVKFILGKYTV